MEPLVIPCMKVKQDGMPVAAGQDEEELVE
jgi:hypothetical protein